MSQGASSWAMTSRGAAWPSNAQVAAASGAPICRTPERLVVSSVASAAASAESLAAARRFLAEIDVIVGRRLDADRDDLHVGAREHVAIPWLHARAARATTPRVLPRARSPQQTS